MPLCVKSLQLPTITDYFNFTTELNNVKVLLGEYSYPSLPTVVLSTNAFF